MNLKPSGGIVPFLGKNNYHMNEKLKIVRKLNFAKILAFHDQYPSQ
jgi:hypothetical protein